MCAYTRRMWLLLGPALASLKAAWKAFSASGTLPAYSSGSDCRQGSSTSRILASEENSHCDNPQPSLAILNRHDPDGKETTLDRPISGLQAFSAHSVVQCCALVTHHLTLPDQVTPTAVLTHPDQPDTPPLGKAPTSLCACAMLNHASRCFSSNVIARL